ncbi:MAG: BamA/TamA family outer membrane protein [Fibrobacter sp.]|nr:BamA/TamA family outer membrane protein [Fibrobacter sp.]
MINKLFIKIICNIFFLISGTYSQNTGQKWIVGEIYFQGNKSYSKDQLLENMKLRPKSFWHSSDYSFSTLVQDIQRINAFYHNRGYLNEEITEYKTVFDTAESKVNITLSISEGQRTVIDTIIITGNYTLSDSLFYSLIDFKKGIFLDSSVLAKVRTDILEKLWALGHLFAKVYPDIQFPLSNLHAVVVLLITEGPAVKSGTTLYFGLHRIDSVVITRNLYFSPESLLTSTKIRQSIASLYLTELFKLVTIQPLDTFSDITQKDTVTAPVLIQLEEGDFFAIQAGGGYGSYEGWYGTLRLGYKNLFGLGHGLFFAGKASFTTFYTGLDYTYPWIFGLPYTLDFNSYVERRNLDAFEGLFEGLTLTVRGSFYKVNSFRVWTNYEHNGWIKTAPGAVTLEKKNTLLFGLSYIRDTRISQNLPGRALFLRSDFELAGPAMSWSNQFYRIRGDLRLYLPLEKFRFSIASALGSGYVQSYGINPEVPSSELYRIGLDDIRPVRGYSEEEISPVTPEGKALGGKFYIVLNLIQFTYPIFWLFNGSLFFDGGFVWANWKDVSLGDMKYSAGAGLSLGLPSGALRVEYGVRLERPFSLLHGRWYLGAGLPF